MKNSMAIIAVIAAFAATSCAKEDGNPSPEKPGRTYPVTIAAGPQATAASRAVWDGGGNYYWEAGDRVGLSVASAGSTGAFVAHNIPMNGDQTTQVLHTTFTGTFTRAQIEAMSPSGSYDYYSCFPYQANAGAGAFPNIRFEIPSVISVEKNRFDHRYAPMVGQLKGAAPITYLAGGVQVSGTSEPIRFDYRHVMAFIAVSMECNLMTNDITSVTVISSSTSGDTSLSGTLNIDMSTGGCNWQTGSNTITASVPAGFNVGDVIYIPMPPKDFSGKTLILRFNTAANPANAETVTVPGKKLEPGEIYALSVKVPFRIAFNETPLLPGTSADPFTYKGYTFWQNRRLEVENGYVNFPGGSASTNMSVTAVLVTPAMNMNTISRRNNIPVEVRIVAIGGTWFNNRRMYYKAVAAGNTATLNFNNDHYLQLDQGNTNNADNYREYTLGTVTLTGDTPCVALDFLTSVLYNGRVREIRLIPKYD